MRTKDAPPESGAREAIWDCNEQNLKFLAKFSTLTFGGSGMSGSALLPVGGGCTPAAACQAPGIHHLLFGTLRSHFLPCFDTAEACTLLRLVNSTFAAAVRDFPWEDRVTVVRGPLASWRAALPNARVACVPGHQGGRRAPLTDADLQHLAGAREVYMRQQLGVSDAGMAALRGVQVLDVRLCTQLTDATLAALPGLRALTLDGLPRVTDAGLAHLTGSIHTLSLQGCRQLSDAGLAHLQGTIRRLNLCGLDRLTDAAFEHLVGIEELDARFCVNPLITEAALQPLRGVRVLNLTCCPQDFSVQAFVSLRRGGIEVLEMGGCSQAAVQQAREAGLGEALRTW